MKNTSSNWEKIVSKKYKEQIFEELFVNISTKKGLAKKLDLSRNTVRRYIIELEKLGYVGKERSIYIRGKRILGQTANLNAFYGYWISQNISLTKTDKDIINFIFTNKKIRQLAMKFNGRDIFQKLANFLLVFCKFSLEKRDYSNIRFLYNRKFIRIVKSYWDAEEDVIKRLNDSNLYYSLEKIQDNLSFHFIIKVFRLTIPYGLAFELFRHPIKLIEEMKAIIESSSEKEYPKENLLSPSKKELESTLKEWEDYKKGFYWWSMNSSSGKYSIIDLSHAPNVSKLFFATNSKIIESKEDWSPPINISSLPDGLINLKDFERLYKSEIKKNQIKKRQNFINYKRL